MQSSTNPMMLPDILDNVFLNVEKIDFKNTFFVSKKWNEVAKQSKFGFY